MGTGQTFGTSPYGLSEPFQFSNFPAFFDAFLIIELHFKRVVTLQQFKIMAPCQFWGRVPKIGKAR